MEEMKQIKKRIQDVIRPNGVGAITAADHQTLLLDIVETIDFNKADKSGRHPAMSVGFADNLTGHGESVPAEFSFRASGGKSIADGVARIKRIKGNSVMVNGGVVHMNTESIKSVGDNAWDEQWEIGGISESNGADYDAGYYIRSSYVRILPNTEYYFKKPQGILTYLYFYNENKEFVGWLDPFATSGEGGMFTTLNASYLRFSCMQTTYNHDIMLTLVHSGWKVDTNAGYQPYWADILAIDPRIQAAFPDGMKAAGDAYDAVMNRNGKGHITKRIASIDLGTLEWGIESAQFAYSQSTIPARVDALGVSRNVICAHLGVKQESYWIATTEDVLMIAENGKVFITGDILKDTSASELKDKLDGVILYYEINAPTTYEYDQPFNLDYRVADFGTEEAISSQPSAPFRADIIYQFNAVDMIRELWAKVQALEAKL